MSDLKTSTVFVENEIEANQYTASCLKVMAAVVACVWILNIIGLFIVPQMTMGIAAVGSLIFFLLPGYIIQQRVKDASKVKFYVMACCILGITLLSCAMPKHSIVAWAAPIVLSCHYYSKKYTTITLVISILCMGISLLIGVNFGEWDANMLGNMEHLSETRIVDFAVYRRVVLFCFLPRAMTLLGLSAVCSTLSNRTYILLERHAEDQMEKQQIISELNVATHIQTSMLPCIFPAFPERKEFDIYASMDPAREVGGDFYDFFMVDEHHLAIVMADVSGKGVPAALFMVIGKTLIKDHTQPDYELGNVFHRVNNLLCESNSENLFITAFEGVLDLRTGEFQYVNAGHELPFICRAGEDFQMQQLTPGFVLAGLEDVKYTSGTMTLNVGDKLFLYTDGVPDAINLQEELYGRERLSQALNRITTNSPEEIIHSIKENIASHVGEAAQIDDITMLCLEYKEKML